MRTSEKCLELIKRFEGLRLAPYLDSVGIPTIGYGSTHYSDGCMVQLSDPEISLEAALELVQIYLDKMCDVLDQLIEVDLNQNQIDAIGCLTYNIGIGNFKKSTLRNFLNSGDFDKAADQFLVWNKAGGKVLPGLEKRRAAERELFIEDIPQQE